MGKRTAFSLSLLTSSILVLILTISFVKAAEGVKLKLTDWSWSNVGENIKIEGVVENHGSHTARLVKIILVARDAHGNYLGNAWTYLRPKDIAPNAFGAFEAYILSKTNNTNKLKLSVQYEFQ